MKGKLVSLLWAWMEARHSMETCRYLNTSIHHCAQYTDLPWSLLKKSVVANYSDSLKPLEVKRTLFIYCFSGKVIYWLTWLIITTYMKDIILCYFIYYIIYILYNFHKLCMIDRNIEFPSSTLSFCFPYIFWSMRYHLNDITSSVTQWFVLLILDIIAQHVNNCMKM